MVGCIAHLNWWAIPVDGSFKFCGGHRAFLPHVILPVTLQQKTAAHTCKANTCDCLHILISHMLQNDRLSLTTTHFNWFFKYKISVVDVKRLQSSEVMRKFTATLLETYELTVLLNQQMLYSVSLKKIPPCSFLTIFPNGWEFFNQFLHAYYKFLSTLDYKFLCNYLQFWRSYAILSATT